MDDNTGASIASPGPAGSGTEGDDALSLLHATVRLNASIFGVILGSLTGFALLVLALVAGFTRHGHASLVVALLGVFLPGYGRSFGGALENAGSPASISRLSSRSTRPTSSFRATEASTPLISTASSAAAATQ